MHQILFLGIDEAVQDIELDENPAERFPCLSTLQFHRDARAQLYALVCRVFLDEAQEMEQLFHCLSDEGPNIYRLDSSALDALARLEEEAVETYAGLWQECEELEALNLATDELIDFLFTFVHFCQIASNDDLNLYIYSDS